MIKQLILDFDTIPEVVSYDELLRYKGKKQFSKVKAIETVANTSDLTLSFLGPLFPNLEKLRLNNSTICSIRDIGCKFPKLKFLSIAQCNITSLDGIETISTNLQELYLAGNKIPDLVDLMSMDQLKIIDLEGNGISNFTTIEILSFCPKLISLTLRNNPISIDPNYRKKIFQILPNLRYLDETRSNDHHADIKYESNKINNDVKSNNKLSDRSLSPPIKDDNKISTNKQEKLNEIDDNTIVKTNSSKIECPSATSTPHSPRKHRNTNSDMLQKRSQSFENFDYTKDSDQEKSNDHPIPILPPSATPPAKMPSEKSNLSPTLPLKAPIHVRANILNARKVKLQSQTKADDTEIMTDMVHDLVDNNLEININKKRLYEKSVFPEVNVLFPKQKRQRKQTPGIIRPISGGR